MTSPAGFVRWGGLAATTGGGLWVVVWAVQGAMPVAPPGGHRTGFESFNAWSGAALVLILVGLTGAYLSQRRRVGVIGHVGFALPWVGGILMGAGRLGQALDVGGGWIPVLLGAFALTVGSILFGIGTVRARVLPPGAGVLLLVVASMLFLTNSEDRRAFLALPFGAAWMWLGYVLWFGQRGLSSDR